ncbi:hypothetical protein Q0812_13230 [Brevundimonas sp. 2R-24]|uniref:Uncharacterized protein n=1 Tax=Peiella sedimenti TaxID=3061083 RepID=A0ABT8SPH9_9CAUL|nr:hypothetical protein [Caulobacteraceae bacterium XZ-24]
MRDQLEALGLKDPTTWRFMPGAGGGPCYDIGPARQTGEVFFERVSSGNTCFWFDAKGSRWAATFPWAGKAGDIVDLSGFGYVARPIAQPVYRCPQDTPAHAEAA